MKKYFALLAFAALAFTGCKTAGSGGASIPALTPVQISALAQAASEAVDQLEASDAITSKTAAKYRSQIAQAQMYVTLASSLVSIWNDLAGQQAAAQVIKPEEVVLVK